MQILFFPDIPDISWCIRIPSINLIVHEIAPETCTWNVDLGHFAMPSAAVDSGHLCGVRFKCSSFWVQTFTIESGIYPVQTRLYSLVNHFVNFHWSLCWQASSTEVPDGIIFITGGSCMRYSHHWRHENSSLDVPRDVILITLVDM